MEEINSTTLKKLKFLFLSLEREDSDYTFELLKDASERMQIPITIWGYPNLRGEIIVNRIPTGYDGYLIEADDVSEDAIPRLREQEPKSKIFGISADATSERRRLPRGADEWFHYLNIKDLERMLEETQEVYLRRK